jgi:hypothetical protein
LDRGTGNEPIDDWGLNARAGTQNSITDAIHRFVLPEDPLMQNLRQAQELLALASIRRDTGMPVQRATMRAISSSVTRSCR